MILLLLAACGRSVRPDGSETGETSTPDTADSSADTADSRDTSDSTDTGDTGDSADSGDSHDTGPEDLPGLWRFGPPAPSVGIYGLAAHPDGTEVYVSNLHVPWLTIVDPVTGAWADAIDLHEAGIDAPDFPLLAVTGRTLWVTAFDHDEVLRFDVDSHAWLGAEALPARGRCIEPDETGLWVGLDGGTAVHLVDDGLDQTVDLPVAPDALAVGEDGLAWVSEGDRSVGWTGPDAWEVTDLPEGQLNDVALLGARVYATDRQRGMVLAFEAGAEVAEVASGSDTFAIYADGDQLLVTNRQGASLPASGAYEGAPGTVVAYDADLVERWTTELDRTIHFLTFDGEKWWAADEDALRMSAFDSTDGTVLVTGPPIGITLDSIHLQDGTLWLPSHLTDEIWTLDDEVIDTCGWPLVAIDGWAPCQLDGQLWHTGEAPLAVASTFQTDCGDDGLCTGHDLLLDATMLGGVLWYSDPYDQTVRSATGTIVPLSPVAEEADHAQHMALAPLDGALYAFEPRDQRVYRVDGDVATPVLDVTTPTADFALTVDEDRLWAGSQSLDGLTVPGEVVAAGDGVILAFEGWDLVAYDRVSLTEVARRDLATLRAPPDPSPLGDPGPLRFYVDGDVVWIGNTFQATLERVQLPTLALLGTNEVRTMGRWEGQR